MTQYLMNEQQLLDPIFRKAVLTEIKAGENVKRKREFKRRYEVYKDQTSQHVIAALAAEGLFPETLAQMQNRAGNISICRKIVNKLARAYSGGVQRSAEPPSAQEAIDDLARLLFFDHKMKNGDRYRELHRNSLLQVLPEVDSERSIDEQRVYKLKFSVLAPWKYDVIEDYYDRETAKVVILGEFNDQQVQAASEVKAGIHSAKPLGLGPETDRKDNIIADAPTDAGQGNGEEYIWWCKSYHFTTDGNGQVIAAKSPPDLLNPIQMLPQINNADEQDGQFWAIGGADLVDGSILINKLITDMNYISYLQGFGQYVVTGQNLAKARFKTGPNNAIVLEYDPSKEEPEPQVQILSANPPIADWMRMIEQYVALLLTTNNLSPSNVSGTLSTSTFPSGIAMLVEQSEATDDIGDKQAEYKNIERSLWEVVKRWQNLLAARGQLSPEYAEIGPLPEDLEITVKFNESKPVVTEAEKLANLQKRKDLGLNEMADLVMLDNPDMTRQEAEEKLLKIQEGDLQILDASLTNSIRQTQSSPQPTDTATGGSMTDPTIRKKPLELVAQDALNGSQVSSLLEIVDAVVAGKLPKESARAILTSAFNMAPERVAQIVDPIELNLALIQSLTSSSRRSTQTPVSSGNQDIPA